MKGCPRIVYETQYRDKLINPLEGLHFEKREGDQTRLIIPRDKTRFQRARLIVIP